MICCSFRVVGVGNWTCYLHQCASNRIEPTLAWRVWNCFFTVTKIRLTQPLLFLRVFLRRFRLTFGACPTKHAPDLRLWHQQLENRRTAAGKYSVGKAHPVGIKREIEGLCNEAREDNSSSIPFGTWRLRVELLDPLDHRQKPQRWMTTHLVFFVPLWH